MDRQRNRGRDDIMTEEISYSRQRCLVCHHIRGQHNAAQRRCEGQVTGLGECECRQFIDVDLNADDDGRP